MQKAPWLISRGFLRLGGAYRDFNAGVGKMAKPSGLDPEDSEGSTPSIRTICARSPIGRGIRFKPCTVWIRIPPGVQKIGNGKDALQCVPSMSL